MSDFKITFELEQTEDNFVHEFDLGHITITYGSASITSKEKKPSQAMMIFTSISHLLFVIRKLYSSHKVKTMEFGADDSSFTIYFRKIGSNIEIYNRISSIIVAKEVFLNEVWKKVKKINDQHLNNLVGSGAAKGDLEAEIELFNQAFDYTNM